MSQTRVVILLLGREFWREVPTSPGQTCPKAEQAAKWAHSKWSTSPYLSRVRVIARARWKARARARAMKVWNIDV